MQSPGKMCSAAPSARPRNVPAADQQKEILSIIQANIVFIAADCFNISGDLYDFHTRCIGSDTPPLTDDAPPIRTE